MRQSRLELPWQFGTRRKPDSTRRKLSLGKGSQLIETLRMRNFLIFAGALLLLAIATIYVWLQFPSSKHPQLIQKALAQSMARFAQSQARAGDPAVNGFQSPLIREALRPGSSGGKAVQIVDRWNQRYSESSVGKSIDHDLLLREKNPTYLNARSDLESILPTMEESFRKPTFVLPNGTVSANSPSLNYIRIRAMAQSASGYLDSVSAEGQPSRGLGIVSSILILGRHLHSQDALISDMIGIAIQAIAFEAVVTNIEPSSPLSADDWGALATSLQEARPDPKQLRYALENELHFGLNSIQSVVSQSQQQGAFPGWARVPGVLGREIRIYKNRIGDHLDAFDRGVPQNQVPLPGMGVRVVLSGGNSFLAEMLIPNMGRCDHQMTINRKKIEGLLVASKLIAYQKSNGKLPKDLAMLGIDGIGGFQYDATTGHLFVPIDPAVLTGLAFPRSADSKLKSNWVEFTAAGLQFRLKSSASKTTE